MKAYVILKGGKFDTLMFDADEVINYFNENKDTDLIMEVKTFDVPKDNIISAPSWPVNIPNIGGYRQSVCKTWEDCTNPCMDCINCPVRDAGTYSTPTMEEKEYIGHTVTVTCTNDTINKQ